MCPWCDKPYDLANSLRKHSSKVHHKKTTVCRKCTKTFRTDEARDNHEADVHGGEDLDDFVPEQQQQVVRSSPAKRKAAAPLPAPSPKKKEEKIDIEEVEEEEEEEEAEEENA